MTRSKVPTPVTGDLATTPLHGEHVALGARMVPFAGFHMAVQYAGLVKEHHAVRTAAGLFDVSHMGQLELTGPNALRTVNRLVTNDVGRLEVGRALYTVCCDERGGILDDLIVYRRGAEQILVVCNASNRTKIASHFASHTRGEGTFVDRSDHSALIALQGPRAFDVLRAVSATPLDLAPFQVAAGSVAGVECWMARTGYTGEDGVEIFCDGEDAVAIWRALLASGEKHSGLMPVGLGARDTLRLEARLCLYGNEIDETTHPYEAGLGWVVKLGKGPFVGREALTEVQKQPLQRRLVGFEMTERGSARPGYAIVADGEPVGRVTSGSPSPTLGKSIGLGYVPNRLALLGSRFSIMVRDKHVTAEVVRTPFYSRKGNCS